MEYLTTARAKGVPERKVLVAHALPNALIPLVTVVGLQVPLLVSGAVGTVIKELAVAHPGHEFLVLAGFHDFSAFQDN